MSLATQIDPYVKAELDGMRKQEILDAWEQLSEWEAAEAFDEMGLDPDEVEAVCGKAAARFYGSWYQWSLK